MSKYETVKTNKYFDAKPKSMVIEKRATNEPVQNKYFQKVISPSNPYNSMQKSAIIQKQSKEKPAWLQAIIDYVKSLSGTPEENNSAVEVIAKYLPELSTLLDHPELVKVIKEKGINGGKLSAAIAERENRGEKPKEVWDEMAEVMTPTSSSPSRVVSETSLTSSPIYGFIEALKDKKTLADLEASMTPEQGERLRQINISTRQLLNMLQGSTSTSTTGLPKLNFPENTRIFIDAVLNDRMPGVRYGRFGISPKPRKTSVKAKKENFAFNVPEYDEYDPDMFLPEDFSANDIPYGEYGGYSKPNAPAWVDNILSSKNKKVSETGNLDLINEATASYSKDEVAELEDLYGKNWHQKTGINSHLPESEVFIGFPEQYGIPSLGGKTPKPPAWDESRKTIETRFEDDKPESWSNYDDYISGRSVYPSERVRKMNNKKNKRKLQ